MVVPVRVGHSGYSLVDVNGPVTGWTAMDYVFAGFNTEWDTTAQETPGRRKQVIQVCKVELFCVFALFMFFSLWFLPKKSKSSTHEPGHQTCCRFGPGDHGLLAVGAQSLPWNIMECRRHYYMCH